MNLKMDTKMTTIRLSEDTHRAVKRIAFESEISFNSWVDSAIQEKLERGNEVIQPEKRAKTIEKIVCILQDYIVKKGLVSKNPNKGPFQYGKNIYIFLDQFMEYIKETEEGILPSKKAIGKVLNNAGGYQETLGFTNGSKSTTRSTYNVSNLITYD